MNNRLQKIVDELYVLARDREKVARARIVAAIVYKNRIVSYGFNQSKTHPFQHRFRKNNWSLSLHAEIDAVKNALRTLDPNQISKATLIIMRVKKDNNQKEDILGLAKPCKGCMDCLATFDINKVYYSTDEQTIEEL